MDSSMIRHSRPSVSLEDRAAVDAVLQSGNLVQGEHVARFEDEFAAMLGVEHAVAVNSGTAALHLALLSLGVGPGDEVLIPAYVCSAVLHAVQLAGATAVLVDVDPGGVNISALDAQRRMTARTKAIVVAHMFGIPAPMEGFTELGIPIVEDCAHAVGATYRGRLAGTWSTVAIFSFRATKVLTTGEGGMLTTSDHDVAAFARDRRDYDKHEQHALRFNYAMTDFQAALGLSQLRQLPWFLARRRDLAAFYSSALSNVPFRFPPVPPHGEPIFYRYVILIEALETMIEALARRGIEAKRPVFRPLHHYLGGQEAPSTDAAHRSLLSIPLYPTLTDDQARRVVAAAIEAYRALQSP
jgi:perosamine synthetase